MAQISLAKAMVVVDEERGKVLKHRQGFPKDSEYYAMCSMHLRSLNRIKKELSLVSDADQLPLGL